MLRRAAWRMRSTSGSSATIRSVRPWRRSAFRSTPNFGCTTPASGRCARHGQPLEPAALVRLEEAAATGADRRAAALARAHNWRTIIIAAAVLVGGIVFAINARLVALNTACSVAVRRLSPAVRPRL